MVDLSNERGAARSAILAAGMAPWWAEEPPARFEGLSPRKFCQRMAQECDLYVLIVGPRYGFTPERTPPSAGELSVTEMEYHWATVESRAKVLVFVRDDAARSPDARQQDFVRRLEEFDTGFVHRPAFTTPEQLGEQVAIALAVWLDERARTRRRYLTLLRDAFATFVSPVTGDPVPIAEIVPLRLAAQADADRQVRETARGAGSSIEGVAGASSVAAVTEPQMPGRAAIPGSTWRPRGGMELASVIARDDRIVLLGDPGAGKTMQLRSLAYTQAQRALDDERERIPFVVPAAAFPVLGGEPLNDTGTAAHIGQVAAESLPGADHPLRRQVVDLARLAVQHDRALILVDGWDEARNAAQRASLADALLALGANPVVVASRYSSAPAWDPTVWRIYSALPLEQAGRRRIVETTIERLGGGEDAPRRFEEAVAARADLAVWIGNPLLLTLLVARFARARDLPASEADLYAYAVDALLEVPHQRSPGRHDVLRRETLVSYLRALALALMQRGETSFSDDELVPLLQLGGARAVPGDATEVAEVLHVREGLLHERVPGIWGFIHLGFQEFLAAQALAHAPGNVRLSVLRRRRLDGRWEHLTRLLVSELDTQGLAQDASAIIAMLAAADGSRIRHVRRRDPLHLALTRATRCNRDRAPSPQVRHLDRLLLRRWHTVWRAELRVYVSFMAMVVRTFPHLLVQFAVFDMSRRSTLRGQLDTASLPYVDPEFADDTTLMRAAEGLGDHLFRRVGRLAPLSEQGSGGLRGCWQGCVRWPLGGLLAVLVLVFPVRALVAALVGRPLDGGAYLALILPVVFFIANLALVFLVAPRMASHSAARVGIRAVGAVAPGRLVELLGRKGVSLEAAEGLRRLGPGMAVVEADLRRLLRNGPTTARAHAARVIGAMGYAGMSLVPALRDASRDARGEAEVDYAALGSLGELAPESEEAQAAVDEDWVRLLVLKLRAEFALSEELYEAELALQRMAPALTEPLLPDLVGILHDSGYCRYEDVAQATHQVVGALYIIDPGAAVRLDKARAVAQIMGTIGAGVPDAWMSLTPILARNEATWRLAGITAMRCLGAVPQPARALLEHLAQSDTHPDVAAAAAAALAALPSEAARRIDGDPPRSGTTEAHRKQRWRAADATPLRTRYRRAMRARDRAGQIAAIEAAGAQTRRGRAQIALLMDGLRSRNRAVREAAIAVIGRVGGRNVALVRRLQGRARARFNRFWWMRVLGQLATVVTDWAVLLVIILGQLDRLAPQVGALILVYVPGDAGTIARALVEGAGTFPLLPALIICYVLVNAWWLWPRVRNATGREIEARDAAQRALVPLLITVEDAG